MRVKCPEKVLRLLSSDCWSPTSASIPGSSGKAVPSAAVTGRPAQASAASRPTVLRTTVLPPVLGPVTTSRSKSPPSDRLSGTTCSASIWRRSSGWRAWRSSMAGAGISGQQPPSSRHQAAAAKAASTWPRRRSASASSWRRRATSRLRSDRIRWMVCRSRASAAATRFDKASTESGSM